MLKHEIIRNHKLLVHKYGYNVSLVQEFAKRLGQARAFTIDRFLGEDENEKFIEPATAAIAHQIIEWESLPGSYSDDWYAYLFQKIDNLDDPLRLFENLNIITFNYDCSFEWEAYQHVLGLHGKEELASEVLSKLNIIHVYGSVGGVLELHSLKARTYGQYPNRENFERIRADIITALEDRKSVTTSAFAEYYEDAKQVFFLGFGYDKYNIDRILMDQFHEAPIYGTTVGLERAEIDHIVTEYFQQARPAAVLLDESEHFGPSLGVPQASGIRAFLKARSHFQRLLP